MSSARDRHPNIAIAFDVIFGVAGTAICIFISVPVLVYAWRWWFG